MSEFWIVALGLGMAFHGLLILWVGGLPHALAPGEAPIAEKGSPEAFGLFWLDQYSYIGLVLSLAGLGLVVWGIL
ncbi:MAG: hypothetical protein OSA83_19995 [Pseudomonadales bacterium]|nr:hypothetical protein [Pseudomonadales bacterium]